MVGESYAGVYVPTIARELMSDPGPINFAGFAVGDGCMGTEVLCGSGNPDKGPFYRVEFMHGHGQVSERNYGDIKKSCPEARYACSLRVACVPPISRLYLDHQHAPLAFQHAPLPEVSPTSRPYLAYISPISRLYLRRPSAPASA